MAADSFLPALDLLRERPTAATRLTGRQEFYAQHTLERPAANPAFGTHGAVGVGCTLAPARCLVFAVDRDGYDVPKHVPRHVRVEPGDGPIQVVDFDVRSIRLDPPDGPTPADIADPTVLPPGWRVWCWPKEIAAAQERAKRFADEDRRQQRR